VRHTPGSYVIGPYLLLHQRIYRLTRGAVGRHVAGRRALLLHTVGRKTGQPRTTALVYARDGDRYVVVASYGGAPRHPAWFLNLEANPEVHVQVGRQHRPAHARVAEAEERQRLWSSSTTRTAASLVCSTAVSSAATTCTSATPVGRSGCLAERSQFAARAVEAPAPSRAQRVSGAPRRESRGP
jgi:deazaflavin-dependent oxidoreductase (nitroreductase family)